MPTSRIRILPLVAFLTCIPPVFCAAPLTVTSFHKGTLVRLTGSNVGRTTPTVITMAEGTHEGAGMWDRPPVDVPCGWQA